MPRFSIKSLLLLVSIFAVLAVPIGFMVRFSTLWGPAEQTENMLSDMCRDMSPSPNAKITIAQIDEKLELPKYNFLKQHRADIDLRPGEIAWFSPNRKYSVGLYENGAILWMVNGIRTSTEHEYDRPS